MKECTNFLLHSFLVKKSKGEMLLDKIEFLKEEENLKKTLSILNDETLNYIEKSLV